VGDKFISDGIITIFLPSGQSYRGPENAAQGFTIYKSDNSVKSTMKSKSWSGPGSGATTEKFGNDYITLQNRKYESL